MKINCFTCKYGYEDERLGIPMCHHPRRFSEDCVNFNMHEEKEIKESENPFKEPIDGVLYAAACGIKNKEQIEESEKPVQNDLEEAAEDFGKRQGLELRPFANKFFIAGAKWDREQMMNEAVEGEIAKDNRGNNVLRVGLLNNGFEIGDKVRIIIINQDEK